MSKKTFNRGEYELEAPSCGLVCSNMQRKTPEIGNKIAYVLRKKIQCLKLETCKLPVCLFTKANAYNMLV